MSMNFERARYNMVEQQVRTWEVLDIRVLDILESIEREDFVPVRYRKLAFADLNILLKFLKPIRFLELNQILDKEYLGRSGVIHSNRNHYAYHENRANFFLFQAYSSVGGISGGGIGNGTLLSIAGIVCK